MKILLTGATGFVGRHLAQALEAAGHQVTAAVRTPAKAQRLSPSLATVAIDFNQALTPEHWADAVAGQQAVVNAVGILRESSRQTFQNLHHRAPAALFSAAAAAGVQRIIQVSALGADDHAQTAYQRTKKAADDHLLSLGVPAAVLLPSVVFGPGSGSARMFTTMARLPIIPLPGDGQQHVQPIHIHDLTDAVVELLEQTPMTTGRLPFVGPEALSLREFYDKLRRALGIARPARFLPIPMPLIQLGANIGSHLPGVLLDRDTLAMLNQGSVGDASVVTALLHRAPRPVEAFLSGPGAKP